MAPYVQLLGVQPSASGDAGSVLHPSGPSHLGWSTDTSGAGGYAGTHAWTERSGAGEHAMMGGMSQLLEDIEMSDSKPASLDGGTHYLALDTNVLIDHLGLVRALYTLCRDVGRGRLVLLIPSVVINELDGLSSSSSGSSPGSSSPARSSLLSSSARSATAFLLSTYRTKSPLPLPDDFGVHPARDPATAPALRCQRWSERLDRAISKPDDRVLDCCLFFRSREGIRSVTLWTADRNLALLAESNDVRTISRPADLEHALRALRSLELDSEDQFWERLERLCVSGVSRRAEAPDADTESVARTRIETALGDLNDDDMELDHDLLIDNGLTYPGAHDATPADAFHQSNQTPLSRPPHLAELSAHSSRRYAPIPPSSSTSPSILRAPSPPLSLPSRIPRIKRIIPHSILSDLTSLFLPISLHLPPPAPAPPTTSTSTSTSPSTSTSLSALPSPSSPSLTLPTPPHLLLSQLLSQLLSAESRLSALSIPLLRTISHLRTIQAFVDPSPSPDARPPRTGEVAEALEELGPLWVVLGVACDRDEFARVAREVREVS